MANKRCHARVRQYGSPYRSARFRGLCACGWKSPYTRVMQSAWFAAKSHDPKFPRGSRPEDLP